MRKHFSCGVLIGLALLVIPIAGILFTAAHDYFGRKGRAQHKARLVVTESVLAIRAFKREYKYPVTGDLTETASNLVQLESVSRKVFRALGGFDHTLNSNRTIYFEIVVSEECGGDGASGDFFDPWCKQYLIRFDDNQDGYVQLGEAKVSAPVVVWSTGPNRINEWGAGDDITSVRSPY